MTNSGTSTRNDGREPSRSASPSGVDATAMAAYALAEPPEGADPRRTNARPTPEAASTGVDRSRRWARLSRFGRASAVVAMLVGHGWLCLACQGGWAAIWSPDPLAIHDHPMHYHNAVVTRAFLHQSGTTAGYDPFFMAGYAKSAVSDPSGTLIEVWVDLFGADNPAAAYKGLLWAIMAALPALIAIAIRLYGGRGDAIWFGTLAFLVYFWTDYAPEYAAFGMTSFLLVVPFGLVVSGLATHYFVLGGLFRWFGALVGASALIFVHPLGVQTAGPAVLAVYAWTIIRRNELERPPGFGRHLGAWIIPPIGLALNAFWWRPILSLHSEYEGRGQMFSHPEPVWQRLAQIFALAEPVQGPIQMILLSAIPIGLGAIWSRGRPWAIALGTFIAAGFFWGYLAGFSRALDSLQPGRNTYAVFAGAAVASGIGWGSIRLRLRAGPGRLDRWAMLGLLLVGLRLFGPAIDRNLSYRTGHRLFSYSENPGARFRIWTPTGAGPYLSSRPDPFQDWLVARVLEHFDPGDRLYYEEGGMASGDLDDPFGGRRYGGLLPELTGVEVIGGPFLHVPVRENFTQIGMGRLFGADDWDRERFDHYGDLYGPEGLICWSPLARAFCQRNPDRCEIVAERSPILVVKLRGFEGETIRGSAEVTASAGRLVVAPGPDDVDEPIVLRYHSVPGLRSTPPGLLRAVEMSGDPVPFIGLRRPEGPSTIEIEWDAPPPGLGEPEGSGPASPRR